jgi:hypothetical protein
VALCDALPYTRVAKHLRLGNKDLKARIKAQVDSTPKPLSNPLGFVEVPFAPENPQAPSVTEIELQRKDGARLRLHAPDTSVPAIVRSFLEA